MANGGLRVRLGNLRFNVFDTAARLYRIEIPLPEFSLVYASVLSVCVPTRAVATMRESTMEISQENRGVHREDLRVQAGYACHIYIGLP